MKQLHILLVVIAASMTISFAPTFSANDTTTQLIDYTGVPILNECTGETVTFSGSMLLVTTNNFNGKNMTSTTVAKPQHLSFKSATGENFKAIGVTVFRNAVHMENGKFVISANNNMLFIGDNGNKYKLNETGRIVYSLGGPLESYDYRRNLRCD